MNKVEAEEILGDWIQDDGTLAGAGRGIIRIFAQPATGKVFVHGYLTPEQLRAVNWWVEKTERRET